MKFPRVILWGLIAIFCILWDVAIAPFIPGLRWIEPVLPMLLFFAMFQSNLSGFVFGIFVGVFIDLYQLADWPAMTVFTIAYLLFLMVVSRRILTNRSFYSAYALLFVGRLAGFAFASVSHGGVGLWDPATMIPLSVSHIAGRLITDFVLLILIFILTSRFQRTLHSSPTVGGLVGYF